MGTIGGVNYVIGTSFGVCADSALSTFMATAAKGSVSCFVRDRRTASQWRDQKRPSFQGRVEPTAPGGPAIDGARPGSNVPAVHVSRTV